jgi:hypothetical protein
MGLFCFQPGVPVSRRLASSRLLQPCSLACYKPPSVTALSSAAASTKQRAGSIPNALPHCAKQKPAEGLPGRGF